jgi:hypothetical protein
MVASPVNGEPPMLYLTSTMFPIFQERSKKAFVGEYQRK